MYIMISHYQENAILCDYTEDSINLEKTSEKDLRFTLK